MFSTFCSFKFLLTILNLFSEYVAVLLESGCNNPLDVLYMGFIKSTDHRPTDH